jgi:cyclophilin family peptidyl-prolyl cis-trans isomerase
MPKRSRRRGKSRRNTWIALGILAILVVSAGGFYAYTTTGAKTTTASTGSGTGTYAVLDTSQGNIVLQLFPQDAPKTVANFESLAESGFYSDLVWHRIVQGFIIQTGDPTTKNGGGNESTWGDGGSGTTIPFENNSLPNDEGYVAMANTSPGGNGASSQFFINLINNPSLTGQYTVFAEVVSGLNVVQAIGNLPVNSQCASSGDLTCQPLQPTQALLISVTIQSTQ